MINKEKSHPVFHHLYPPVFLHGKPRGKWDVGGPSEDVVTTSTPGPLTPGPVNQQQVEQQRLGKMGGLQDGPRLVINGVSSNFFK